ncbi:glycoside hydrolase [Anaerosporomusa subterranea]|uniref:Glycoside hydrolase n=1 Tax=Anaerosporomusa subterranea TaxID=1794912 RepID=A0A154BNI0_ANASB|nr:glycoside hydrolase [Anaerosporomusa subterranea]
MLVYFALTIQLGSLAVASAASLKPGDSGSEVRILQEQLQKMQYEISEVDGVYGIQTQQAVEQYQMSVGLEVDDIVGAETWEALRASRAGVNRSFSRRLNANGILSFAKRFIGVPYLWGGNSPAGFDCSGFTQYVFRASGISLPRTADVQFQVGIPIRYDQLKSGDLVFFSTYEPGPSHNGIYLGDGNFISATSSRGIAIDRMSSPYWSSRYVGARRVIG